ncbi:Sugar transferase [Bosea sp. LC85]|uniref:sugar transferase n=1 Tax=Bosea sp. LC85 TaxID=1502851 RepID=UPI0004E3125F|nr:sugar transferase [Bosea sp. LC85]KFC70984.1 Sugar transferase [Bosea sp. LC85]
MSGREDRRSIAPPLPITLAFKRTLDVVGSALGLIMLSPIFPIVAIAIKRDSPGPIFFRQDRVGRDGRVFQIYKFRSMAVRPVSGVALTLRGDKRVTHVGAFLRRSKLDELPQLINVLSGDMSLVGPRPEVPEFMEFYSPEQRAIILSMRPGITDYAAILFRDESSLLDRDDDPVALYRHKIMPIKFGYYERYSRDIGVLTDLRITLATIVLLLVGQVPRWLGIESELPVASVPASGEASGQLDPPRMA